MKHIFDWKKQMMYTLHLTPIQGLHEACLAQTERVQDLCLKV